MTLAINVTLPEGMVFATDTRFTYRNRSGTARVGSDSMSKIVPLGSHMLVSFAGFPFLEQDGEQISTLSMLKDFSQTIGAETSVDVVSERLLDLLREPFEAQYRKSINRQQALEMLQLQGASQISIDDSQVPYRATFRDRDGRERNTVLGNDRHLTLLVGGFEPTGRALLYRLDVPHSRVVCVDSDIPSRKYGSTWIGQAEVLMRLVAGYDPRIMNVPLIQEAGLQQGAEGLQEQLQSVHYVINWGMMTLQDGIDFSVMGINVTSEVQRFTDGIRSAPGAFPVVGPRSHVAVITRERGFEWIARPQLHAQGTQ